MNFVGVAGLALVQLAGAGAAVAAPGDKPAARDARSRPGAGSQPGRAAATPGAQHYNPPGYNPPGHGPGHNPPGYNPPGHRPPGNYYRPPPPPPGGWHGGYYPPPRYYYYDNGPTAGEVIAGVAVTAGLIALLSSAGKSAAATPATTPAGAAPGYVPPQGSTGKPATINVNFGTLTPEARPSASTCITEAARQIGATGGREISIASFDKVEPGNGGYRFTLALSAIYPDATRRIPMYCRATPEKIVELKFG